MNNQAEIDRLKSTLNRYEHRLDKIHGIIHRWRLSRVAQILSKEERWRNPAARVVRENESGHFEIIEGYEDYFFKEAPEKIIKLQLESNDLVLKHEKLTSDLNNLLHEKKKLVRSGRPKDRYRELVEASPDKTPVEILRATFPGPKGVTDEMDYFRLTDSHPGVVPGGLNRDSNFSPSKS
jgi:hypothetical protein